MPSKLLAAVLAVLALMPPDRPCTCGAAALGYTDSDESPSPPHHDDECESAQPAPAFDAPTAAADVAPPVALFVAPADQIAVAADPPGSPRILRPPRLPLYLSLQVLRN